MRLYTCTNWMLRTIQQGIQPLHVAVEMANTYERARTRAGETYREWATQHKTAISLNGGTYGTLVYEYAEVCGLAKVLRLPVASFHEDQESLGGLMTSWGIVVPEYIYNEFADARSASNADLDTMSFAKLLECRFPHEKTDTIAARKLARMLAIKPLAT